MARWTATPLPHAPHSPPRLPTPHGREISRRPQVTKFEFVAWMAALTGDYDPSEHISDAAKDLFALFDEDSSGTITVPRQGPACSRGARLPASASPPLLPCYLAASEGGEKNVPLRPCSLTLPCALPWLAASILSSPSLRCLLRFAPLQVQEFMEGLKRFNIDLSPDEVTVLIEELDEDRSGDIALEEFEKLLRMNSGRGD